MSGRVVGGGGARPLPNRDDNILFELFRIINRVVWFFYVFL